MEPVSQRRNRSRTLSRKAVGQQMERLACRYLQQSGLVWVASNVLFRCGEIDIIMRENACWVFVEVRYRRNNLYGGAIASVTREKQKRLYKAAACWLAIRQQSLSTTECRFDVVAITGAEIQWIQNAFNAD